MDKFELTLAPRTVIGKKVKHLRTQGLVPVAICGKGVTPENYVTDARIFTKVYQRAGKNGLIELQTPTGVLNAFIRQIQRHPLSNVWLHVDFHVVDMRTPITAAITVVAIGENKLTAEGIVNINTPTIHVRALPGDMPQNIEVDISGITEYNTPLHVSDLRLGDKVEILAPPDEPVLSINLALVAAEDEEPTEEADTPDGMTINDPTKATEETDDA